MKQPVAVPLPLDAARAAVAAAERALVLSRGALADTALEVARHDGQRGEVHPRAAALLGVSESTLHRWRREAKSTEPDHL